MYSLFNDREFSLKKELTVIIDVISLFWNQDIEIFLSKIKVQIIIKNKNKADTIVNLIDKENISFDASDVT